MVTETPNMAVAGAARTSAVPNLSALPHPIADGRDFLFVNSTSNSAAKAVGYFMDDGTVNTTGATKINEYDFATGTWGANAIDQSAGLGLTSGGWVKISDPVQDADGNCFSYATSTNMTKGRV